jgi:hypothetical protein
VCLGVKGSTCWRRRTRLGPGWPVDQAGLRDDRETFEAFRQRRDCLCPIWAARSRPAGSRFNRGCSCPPGPGATPPCASARRSVLARSLLAAARPSAERQGSRSVCSCCWTTADAASRATGRVAGLAVMGAPLPALVLARYSLLTALAWPPMSGFSSLGARLTVAHVTASHQKERSGPDRRGWLRAKGSERCARREVSSTRCWLAS